MDKQTVVLVPNTRGQSEVLTRLSRAALSVYKTVALLSPVTDLARACKYCPVYLLHSGLSAQDSYNPSLPGFSETLPPHPLPPIPTVRSAPSNEFRLEVCGGAGG